MSVVFALLLAATGSANDYRFVEDTKDSTFLMQLFDVPLRHRGERVDFSMLVSGGRKSNREMTVRAGTCGFILLLTKTLDAKLGPKVKLRIGGRSYEVRRRKRAAGTDKVIEELECPESFIKPGVVRHPVSVVISGRKFESAAAAIDPIKKFDRAVRGGWKHLGGPPSERPSTTRSFSVKAPKAKKPYDKGTLVFELPPGISRSVVTVSVTNLATGKARTMPYPRDDHLTLEAAPYRIRLSMKGQRKSWSTKVNLEPSMYSLVNPVF
ncbi:MAG: hypothetical protein AAF654_01860 [Myxococcota bacterium]